MLFKFYFLLSNYLTGYRVSHYQGIRESISRASKSKSPFLAKHSKQNCREDGRLGSVGEDFDGLRGRECGRADRAKRADLREER